MDELNHLVNFRFESGRLLLFSQNLDVTLPRGIHCVAKTLHSVVYSTEGIPEFESKGSEDGSVLVKFPGFPIEFQISARTEQQSIGISVNLKILNQLEITELLIRFPLLPSYDVCFAPKFRQFISSGETGCILADSPPRAFYGFASVDRTLPPIRISFCNAASLQESRIERQVIDGVAQLYLDVIVMKRSEMKEQNHRLQELCTMMIEARDDYAPMIKYPREFFSKCPIPHAFALNLLSSAHAERLLTVIQSRFPFVWTEGKMKPMSIEFLSNPSGLFWILKEMMRIRKYNHCAMLISLQPHAYWHCDWRLIVLCFLSGFRYMIKIDPSGSNEFVTYDFEWLLRKGTNSLRRSPKNTTIRLLEISVISAQRILEQISRFIKKQAKE